MIKKNFIGVMTPCVAAALFMSGILSTGCSQDEDFDNGWDEDVERTFAEQKMTRSGDIPVSPTEPKPNEKETRHTFSAEFLFAGRRISIPGSAVIELSIVTDTLGKYKRHSYNSFPDRYTSISNLSVTQGVPGRYTVSVTAYYIGNASFSGSTYVTDL